MIDCYDHFIAVASEYRRLRTTDEAPVEAIRQYLVETDNLCVADIGCGTGRYSQLLCHYLGPSTKMFCVDANHTMLKELAWTTEPIMLPGFVSIQARASALPFGDATMDVVTSFNAVHHFDVPGFLTEASRVLNENGKAFIYTRLSEQNATNVWGRYFPGFHETETRLYTASELSDYISRHFGLARMWAVPFFFYRQASLEALLEQARRHHYSTFYLYDRQQFEDALDEFEENIRMAYADPDVVDWTDSYTLFSLEKQSRSRSRRLPKPQLGERSGRGNRPRARQLAWSPRLT